MLPFLGLTSYVERQMVRGIILPGSSQTTRPVLGPARPLGAEALANIQAKSGNDVKEVGIKQKLICAQV